MIRETSEVRRVAGEIPEPSLEEEEGEEEEKEQELGLDIHMY